MHNQYFRRRFAALAALVAVAFTAGPRAQVSTTTTTAVYTTWDQPTSFGGSQYVVTDRDGAANSPSPEGTVWYTGHTVWGPDNPPGIVTRFQPGANPETDPASWMEWPTMSGPGEGIDISQADQVFYIAGTPSVPVTVERLDPATNRQTRWPAGALSYGIDLSSDGPDKVNAWFLDASNRVARLTPAGPESNLATVTRWAIPSIFFGNGAAGGIRVHPQTGLVYVASYGNSSIVELNPATGAMRRWFVVRDNDLSLPSFLDIAPDGTVWVRSRNNVILQLNPQTSEIATYRIPGPPAGFSYWGIVAGSRAIGYAGPGPKTGMLIPTGTPEFSPPIETVQPSVTETITGTSRVQLPRTGTASPTTTTIPATVVRKNDGTFIEAPTASDEYSIGIDEDPLTPDAYYHTSGSLSPVPLRAPIGRVRFILDVPAATISLDPLAATNRVGEQHCVTAAVLDAAGAASTNSDVFFSVAGANASASTRTTDATGHATFCYTGTTSGADTITAIADANRDHAAQPTEPNAVATKLYIGTPATVTVTPLAATNPAGVEHCVGASVRDATGNAVPSTSVLFSVTGANSASGSEVTNANGEAGFCYTGTRAGSDLIRAVADSNANGAADAGEPDGTATNIYVATAPATLTLTPPAATNPVGTQHCVTATSRDAFANPTPNVAIVFSVSGASTAAGTVATNASGEAQYCYGGPALPGQDTITAYADGNANHARDVAEPLATATKTWVLPVATAGCGVKITGGGSITTLAGTRGTFGGNATLSLDGDMSSKAEYHDHGAAAINVHSIEVLAITCDSPSSATIFGRARINGSGSYLYRIRVQDTAEPGSSDTYGILLETGYYSGEQRLDGGNIQIRR